MALVIELGNGVEYLLMGVGVEVLGADDLEDVADDAIIPQHAPQDAPLRVPVLGRQAVPSSLGRRHGSLAQACRVRCADRKACDWFVGVSLFLFLLANDQDLDLALYVVAEMEFDRE